jgi:thiamine kinase-like enzyme
MVHDDHRVLLIDYDQAGMNDPAYDLGVLMAEASVFEDEAMAWLKEWDPQASYPLLYRAQLYGALDDLLWAVRAAVQAHISERIHVEFRKYSEWRFMRARRILADRRFEWMLRVVNEA